MENKFAPTKILLNKSESTSPQFNCTNIVIGCKDTLLLRFYSDRGTEAWTSSKSLKFSAGVALDRIGCQTNVPENLSVDQNS